MDYVRRYKKMNLFSAEKKDNNISKFVSVGCQALTSISSRAIFFWKRRGINRRPFVHLEE